MKKALLVTRVSGFVPQHESNNVKLLQELGYEVHYATNLHTVVYGTDNRRLEGTGIITHQIDFQRSPFSRGVKKSYRQLKELMLREQFDLIHCHMPMSGVIARIAAQKVSKMTGRRVPVIYTAHGFHFFRGAHLRNWCYYPVERFMSRYTDRLILINEEDYRRGLTFPIRGRVEKISGVGIRLERFAPYQKQTWDIEEKGIREKYGIPADYRILVSIGELAPGKNNMISVEAMQQLADLKVAYLICGTGRMEEALRDKVRELHLEKSVFFAGYVEDTPALLQQCDIFLFPSEREGLPVALMEAMAVGLPVVASDIRGIHDLIEHTKGGYLVRGFAPDDYAVKVRRLLEEKAGKSAVPREERRKQMGWWNQKQVQNFSLSVVEKEMRKIYMDISDTRE